MKKLLIVASFFASIGFASAQVDKVDDQQPDQDQIQQQPPRNTQSEVERAARIDAEKKKNDDAIEAEKKSKDKGQSKNYTKVNPDKLSPVRKDSTTGVQPVKKPRNK
jgi:hypothetical protein